MATHLFQMRSIFSLQITQNFFAISTFVEISYTNFESKPIRC